MMLIVAGPNGAGKTTATNKVIERFGDALTKLNADEQTLKLKKTHPNKPLPEVNLLAAQHIDAEVDRHIEEGKSFYVETVLSSPKYRDDVLKAKEQGFEFSLVYVSLHPPELSPERVKIRAQKGGHDVEWNKALARYERSHIQLEWFMNQADNLLVFDNSAEEKPPILIAAKMAGQEITHRVKGVNPAVDRVVKNVQQRKLNGLEP